MPDPETIMVQYVIYRHPKDYPGQYVVRKWHIMKGQSEPEADKECQAVDTLEAARKLVPPGMYCMGRAPGDDPIILEVWV